MCFRIIGTIHLTLQPSEGTGSDVLFGGACFHCYTYRSLCIVTENTIFTPVRQTGFSRFERIYHVLQIVTSGGVQWVILKP